MLLHNKYYVWNPYFGNQKCWCVHLEGRGIGGLKKVYCLYTHENVDIFGWPLIEKWIILEYTSLSSHWYPVNKYINSWYGLVQTIINVVNFNISYYTCKVGLTFRESMQLGFVWEGCWWLLHVPREEPVSGITHRNSPCLV